MAKYIRETGEAIEITPEMIQGMEILLEMITSRNIAAEMCASWRKTKTKREEACKIAVADTHGNIEHYARYQIDIINNNKIADIESVHNYKRVNNR